MSFIRFIALLLLCVFVFNCKSENSKTNQTKVFSETPIDTLKIKKEINADEKAALIAQEIDSKIANGFNGTVLVAQKDVIVYQKAFGKLRLEDSVLLNMNSKFQLASLSKTFTAVATMKLVEEGKIGLENTVKDYIPTFPYDGVTIRSLLSHRSGLPYYQYEFDKKVRDEKVYPTNQQIVDWFCTAKPTPKPLNLPEHFFTYNNTNFALLAAIIEKVSGQTFDEYLREKVLLPSGMYNTYAITTKDTTKLNINKTTGYQFNRKVPKDYYDNIIGDKGIYSTAPDLFRYYKMLKSERVLKKETLREMYTPRSFERPGLRNYGYGFRLWVNDKQQTDYVYHTGWWKGYNTIMFFDLRSDFVIIVLSNKYNKGVYNLKKIVDILHGQEQHSEIEENILDQ